MLQLNSGAGGDKLININSGTVKGSLADVLDALRGKPGEAKTLVVERDRKQLTVKTSVASLFQNNSRN